MDLRTTYMGMTLKNPLVVSACQPLTDDIGKIKKIEDAGAAAGCSTRCLRSNCALNRKNWITT